jgi:hypothetical protein
VHFVLYCQLMLELAFMIVLLFKLYRTSYLERMLYSVKLLKIGAFSVSVARQMPAYV